MSVCDIRRGDAAVLRRAALPVTVFDGKLGRLVSNLWETMFAAKGVGLAAPQIGKGVRVAVVQYAGFSEALINPTILGKKGHVVDEEGCLSVRGGRRPISRADTVTVRWQNLAGIECQATVSGFAARVIQHELDHLDGRLITDPR